MHLTKLFTSAFLISALALAACTGGEGSSDEAVTVEEEDANSDVQTGGDADPQESCTDGQTRPCGTSEGACTQGTQTCNGGQWTDCQGETAPSDEICDGKDNDCDGEIDENLRRSCFSGDSDRAGTGVCQKGVQECSSGEWGECEGEVTPSSEACDGRDNDCDGQIDEDCDCTDGETQECGESDEGVCEKGTQTCSDGSWGACEGEVTPSDEVCDNRDNDCDGTVDEATKTAGTTCDDDCECFSGVCSESDQTCAQRIFVTDPDHSGTFGSLAAADQICNTAASDAGLSGTWAAIISDNSNDAKSRLRIISEIYTTNGDKIADGANDLWDGTLDNAISSSRTVVWTGTEPDGTAADDNCGNWSGTIDGAEMGVSDTNNNGWISFGVGLDCNLDQGLYCIDGQ